MHFSHVCVGETDMQAGDAPAGRLLVVVLAARRLLDDILDACGADRGCLDARDAEDHLEAGLLLHRFEEGQRLWVRVERRLQVGGNNRVLDPVGGVPAAVGLRALDLGEVNVGETERDYPAIETR